MNLTRLKTYSCEEAEFDGKGGYVGRGAITDGRRLIAPQHGQGNYVACCISNVFVVIPTAYTIQ